MYIQCTLINCTQMRRRVKNQHRQLLKKKIGQKVAFIQLVPKIKVLKLRIGADWCRVRTLHADVNQMVLLGVSLPPLLLYQRQLIQIILKSEIYAYSPEEVQRFGSFCLHPRQVIKQRIHVYCKNKFSCIIHVHIYIQEVFGPHSGV